MEKPILILQKNAEKSMNKVVIPKAFVTKWGNEFYMEVYADKIVLVPVKKGR